MKTLSRFLFIIIHDFDFRKRNSIRCQVKFILLIILLSKKYSTKQNLALLIDFVTRSHKDNITIRLDDTTGFGYTKGNF